MNRTVDVCHFVEYLALGGLEKQLIRLIQSTEDEGISYTVCYFGCDDTLRRELEELGIRTVNLGSPSENHVFEFTPWNLYSVTKFLKEHEFDVLHCHTPLFLIVLGRICGALADVAVVSTFHNTKENFHPTIRFGEQVTRPLSALNLCVSKGVELSYNDSTREYSADVNELERKMYTVYNGIDVDGFSEELNAADPDRVASHWGIHGEPIFLCVGRYSPIKNQDCLIRAMDDVLEELPDAHLLLVGTGEQEATLRATINKLGLRENITVTGQVPDIHEYYAFADISLLPSLSEGLSLVLLESMVARLPVIASDIPGNNEAVIDGETGYLVTPDSSSAMATAMIRMGLLEDRNQFGERGYQRVSKKFDIRDMAHSYLDIYQRFR